MKISIMVASTVMLLALKAAAQVPTARGGTAPGLFVPPATLRWPRVIGGAFGASATDGAVAFDNTSRATGPRPVAYKRATAPATCFLRATPMPTMRSSSTDTMPNVANVSTRDSTVAAASRACADSNRPR